jgi:hypothetical protein
MCEQLVFWHRLLVLSQRIVVFIFGVLFLLLPAKKIKRVFATDPDQNGVLEETPRSLTDSYR